MEEFTKHYYCVKCGKEVDIDDKICPHCKKRHPVNRTGYAKKYFCVECGKELNQMHQPICPFCKKEQPIELRAASLGDAIVDIKCEKCGSNKSFYRSSDYLDDAWCVKCGETTYVNEDGKKPMPISKTAFEPEVVCPYCHSTNTKKISTMSKAANVALFGIFAAGKVAKEWHCNDCKSDF